MSSSTFSLRLKELSGEISIAGIQPEKEESRSEELRLRKLCYGDENTKKRENHARTETVKRGKSEKEKNV